jgi:hypothetical protein
MVVPATVQTIADATGTVREVVTRLLRELREEGLVGRHNGSLVLLDLAGIHSVSAGQRENLQNCMPRQPRKWTAGSGYQMDGASTLVGGNKRAVTTMKAPAGPAASAVV